MTERNYLYLNAHQHYIVYKTTNQINGKYYIGVHAQDKDPRQEDGYIGSGPVLQAAIKKYGKEILPEKLYSCLTIMSTHMRRKLNWFLLNSYKKTKGKYII